MRTGLFTALLIIIALFEGSFLFGQSSLDLLREPSFSATINELMAQGKQFMEDNDFDEAIVHFAAALEKDPNHHDSRYYMGMCYSIQCMAAGNMGACWEAVQSFDEVENQAGAIRYLNFYRAECKVRLKDFQGALKDYSEALAAEEDPYYYAQRAQVNLVLGKSNPAIADLTNAIRLEPKEVTHYLNRAIIFRKKGDYFRAIQDHDQTLRFIPDFAHFYAERALTHQMAGKTQLALRDFNFALGIAPKDPELYHDRGLIKSQLGMYEEAIEDLNQALLLSPEDGEIYYLRSQIHILMDDEVGACADLHQSAELGHSQGRIDHDEYCQ